MIFKIILLLLFIVGLGVLFYWYEWRPSDIRKSCDVIAWEHANKRYSNRSEAYKFKYEQCLHSKGLR